MKLFIKDCQCGGIILGPRVGGRKKGEWLGHDKCPKCQKTEAGK